MDVLQRPKVCRHDMKKKLLEEITPDLAFLQAILNAIPSGIFVLDRRQNILLINKAGAELAGRTPGDCFDRKCYEIFDTFICRTDFCPCFQSSQNGSSSHGTSVMRSGGREIPIEYASQPLKNAQGKIIGCVEYFTEISDRIKKERTIKLQHERVMRLLKEKVGKNIELDRANAELLQLSYDIEALAQERTVAEMALKIADRIRNPATAIGGLARALRRDLPDELKDNPKLRAIDREVERLESRVRSFEVIAAEQKKLFVREDLRAIVAEVINTSSASLTKKDIELHVRKPAVPVLATVNRATLKVALLHVLKNAVEASSFGAHIEIGIRYHDGHPVIRVIDRGTGIPENIKGRLFAGKISTKVTGLGVGLLMVRQVINEHQGRVNIKSSPGVGTAVTFTFPVRWEGGAL